MAKTNTPTAILLFTRSAGQDAARKKLVSNRADAANVAVMAQLINHATTTAQQVGVDFLRVDYSRQTGATFGERLSEAMQAAFASGYERLLVIGNDCPRLAVPLLLRALAVLESTGAVLGPATDGGVYLLGVARAYFDPAAWCALPWQTAKLGQALATHLEAAGAIVRHLSRLADVDNAHDLAQALRRPIARPLLRALRRLRQAPAPFLGRAAVGGQPASAAAQPHRGPPNC